MGGHNPPVSHDSHHVYNVAFLFITYTPRVMKAILRDAKRNRREKEESIPSHPAASIANIIPITKLIIIYLESIHFTIMLYHNYFTESSLT